jgi:hypothetical protein
MFCPKCGSQNAGEAKFCRACGADLSNVLAIIEGKLPTSLTEKHIDLFGSGLRGLMVGLGFLIVSVVAYRFSPQLAVAVIAVLFALAFAFFFLASGISRLVQARAIKNLLSPTSGDAAPALSPGAAEYIQPPRSVFQTDDLATTPRSVTENTTKHLKMDSD